MSSEAIPLDSRYVPFTQQPWCCVPTSIQMILYKNNLPLVPAEEIGYELGLTVPPEEAGLFYNVRVSETPPTGAGYGTQINNPDYEPNAALRKLDIPLKLSVLPASEITDETSLLDTLERVEANNGDSLLCFNHGVVRGRYEPNSGHVVVFDRVVDGQVRVVDASWKNPKWRLISTAILFDAIQQHGDENSGGIWNFTRI